MVLTPKMALSGRQPPRQNRTGSFGRVVLQESAMHRLLPVAIMLLGSCLAWAQEAPPTVIPPPKVDGHRGSGSSEKALLAGGCYWGTQGIFEHVRGIKRVVAGFSAGRSDEDGGAESVMITFDPKVLSYGRLLQIFFSVVNDPTELDRQGPDVGPGYRSDIFYMSPDQRRVARAYIAQLDAAKVFPKPIVTRVDAFSSFNPVDLSQQDFMRKNPHLEYIEVNDLPKLVSLKRLFPTSFRASPLEYHQ
jgi:peptide-methionine (S)-S-oxide reductase